MGGGGSVVVHNQNNANRICAVRNVKSNNDVDFWCPIPPTRLFKAAVVDGHNIIPKIIPNKIKNIEIQGDGGAGSIKQINFAAGGSFPMIKYRIEEVDEQNFKFKFTLIEGALVGEKVEKVVETVQFLPSNGGSIIKTTSEFHSTGDSTMGEEEIKMGNDITIDEILRLVVEYLSNNPTAYV